MGYVGSYMWKMRQKVGRMRILPATVDVLPINEKGQIKLAVSEQFGGAWSVIGGHVEYGDSWASAALNELREEAGIDANKEDLIPWATISGSGRVFHYKDGTTQPFTLTFLCRKWNSEGELTDTEEIVDSGWFDVDEALKLELTSWCRLILEGYKEYLKTGKFQMIEEEEEWEKWTN